MPKVHYVKKSRKDNPAVKKGQPYYWWEFRYGGKRYSATEPKPYQLTQSPYKAAALQLQERIESMHQVELKDLDDAKEEIVEEIQQMLDEAQDSLDNIPEHLQETHMLYERVEQTQEWIDALESVDTDVDMVDLALEVDQEGMTAKEADEALEAHVIEKRDELVEELEAAYPGF